MCMEFLYTVAIQVVILFVIVGVLFMFLELCFGSYNIMNVFFIIMEFLLRIVYPMKLEEQEQKIFDDDDYTRVEITVAQAPPPRNEQERKGRFLINQQVRFISESSSVTTCPLCLCDFVPDEVLVVLKCHQKHLYHEKCINEYLDKTDKHKFECMLCRQKIKFEFWFIKNTYII